MTLTAAVPADRRPADFVPPPDELAGRPPAGSLGVAVSAGPVRVRVAGCDAATAAAVDGLAPGSTDVAGVAILGSDIDLVTSDRTSYLAPARPGERYRVLVQVRDGTVLAVSHAWAMCLQASLERGVLALVSQAPDDRERSVQNALRVAVAARLVAAGTGLLVHAAAVEVEPGGDAVLFVGPSGAGKTTACRQAGRRRVLADDVAIVTTGPDGGWLVHESPLWAEAGLRQGGAGRGPARLAATCLLRQAPAASLRSLARGRAAAALAACAPFAHAAGFAEQALEGARALAAAVPAFTLDFTPDPGFWNVLVPAVRAADQPGAAG